MLCKYWTFSIKLFDYQWIWWTYNTTSVAFCMIGNSRAYWLRPISPYILQRCNRERIHFAYCMRCNDYMVDGFDYHVQRRWCGCWWYDAAIVFVCVWCALWLRMNPPAALLSGAVFSTKNRAIWKAAGVQCGIKCSIVSSTDVRFLGTRYMISSTDRITLLFMAVCVLYDILTMMLIMMSLSVCMCNSFACENRTDRKQPRIFVLCYG